MLTHENAAYYDKLKDLTEKYDILISKMYPSRSNAQYHSLTTKICFEAGELKGLLQEINSCLVTSADKGGDVNIIMQRFFEGFDRNGKRYVNLDKYYQQLKDHEQQLSSIVNVSQEKAI